jgi:hypothetical protein
MGRVAELSLGDIVRGLAHYKPVALVVVGILAVVALTPGGLESAADPIDLALDASPGGAADGRQAPGTGNGAGAAASDDGTVSFDVPPPSPSFSPAPAPGAGSGPAPTFGGAGDDEGAFAGPPGGTSTFGGDAQGEEPLVLAVTAWATNAAGTPLGEAGVPAGTLPVGNRLGRHDKASFVRVTGTATELVLLEDPEGRRDAPTGDAPAVQACRVEVAGWADADAQSFDEAPTWDPDDCVDGVAGDDGRWVFDLATFVDVDDDRGFALVPTDDAPVDFQVAFVDTTA